MAEAIVRIQRVTTEFGRQIADLRRNTDSVLERLRAIDPALATAGQQLAIYRGKLQETGGLTADEQGRIERLQQFISRRAETLVLSQRGRPLTAEERTQYQTTGRYTDEQLERARMIRRTLVVPKPPPPLPIEATTIPREEVRESSTRRPASIPSLPASATAGMRTDTAPAIASHVPTPQTRRPEALDVVRDRPDLQVLSDTELEDRQRAADRRRAKAEKDIESAATSAVADRQQRENYRARLAERDPEYQSARVDQLALQAEAERRAMRTSPPRAQATLETSTPPRAAATSAGGSGGEPPDDGVLTPPERAEYVSRGYAEADLNRAHRLGQGRIVIPPSRSPIGPRVHAPTPAEMRTTRVAQPFEGPEQRDRTVPLLGGDRPARSGPERRQGPEVRTASTLHVDGDGLEVSVRQQATGFRALTQEKRLDALGDQELRREWRANQTELRQQDRDIERTIAQLKRLREASRSDPVGHSERGRQLRSRLQDLHQGREALLGREDALATEAGRRHMRPEGPVLLGGPGGGGSRGGGGGRRGGGFWRGYLGAAGFGSGAPAIGLDAIMGTISPLSALGGLLGLITGKAIQTGTQAYERYVSATGQVLPLAIGSGRPADRILGETRGLSDRYRQFTAPEIRGAMLQLARVTGHTGMRAILDVASLTGEGPQEAVMRAIELNRLNVRYDPFVSARVLQAYGRSTLATPHPAHGPILPRGQTGPPAPNRGLRYETLRYGEFSRHVAELSNAMATPFTRLSPEGVGEELSAVTRDLRVPGVDMRSAGGVDVAKNLVRGANTLVGREQGGLLGQLQLMAVARLRGNRRLAERLRRPDIDIDLNSPAGMLRAIHAAPRLATMGIPEVAEAIYRSATATMRPDIAELMIGDQLGDRDLAHTLVSQRRGMAEVFRAPQQQHGPLSPEVEEAAKAEAGRPDVERYYNLAIRPDNQVEQLGQNLIREFGDRITKGMDDLRGSVFQALTEFFNKDPSVEARGIEGVFPGMTTRR